MAGFTFIVAMSSAMLATGRSCFAEPVDVGGVLQARQPAQARDAIYDVYRQVILEGDASQAMIAFAVVMYEKDAQLADAIRRRIDALGDSTEDLVLKSIGLHALAVAGGESHCDEVIPLVQHHNGRVRHAALDAAREMRPSPELLGALEERAVVERDPALRPAVSGALCRLDPQRKSAHLTELETMATGGEPRSRLAALLELDGLGELARVEGRAHTLEAPDEQAIAEALGGRDRSDEALIGMMMGRNHAARLKAVQVVAERGSPAMRKWMERSGESEHVQARLMGAYYLYLLGDGREAARRLGAERDGMVQAMLLGAVLKEAKGGGQ